MGKRIFITLGSQKFQFNRLLKAVDALCENGTLNPDDVFAQIGYSDYLPKNYQFRNFLDRDKFGEEMSKAEIVITHGGTGAIVGALKKGKKVIAVPRLAKYGEHVDDHQLQIIGQFGSLNMIVACNQCEELSTAIRKAEQCEFREYVSNTGRILQSIDQYITDVFHNEGAARD